MLKKVISLFLCLLMVATLLVGCAKKDEDDKGAYIYMYLTDMVYDLDPARAFNNESALRVVSLLYDNLFVLDEDGKVKKSLAKDYEIKEDEALGEYTMTITLNETCWTDGIPISANDVVYAFRRTLDPEAAFGAAPLLFDIKNARAVKEGDVSIDDLGVSAPQTNTVEIRFETKIDYEQFLINLTSYALVPLREDIVSRSSEDWAKKPATMCTSGPFRLRTVSLQEVAKNDAEGKTIRTMVPETMVLERNAYYYRDMNKDAWDKSVTPYRLIIDYTMTDEQILAAYNEGKIFYVGDIPMSVRASYKDIATVSDALSTHTYVPNHNAVIRYYDEAAFATLTAQTPNMKLGGADGKTLVPLEAGVDGEQIFANASVRRALSLAIDRTTIAQDVVFAQAATGLVPNGMFDTDRKTSFREVGGSVITTAQDPIAEAKAELAKSGIDAGKFMFTVSVSAYDDVHMAIAEKVVAAWNAIGFHVALNAIDVRVNDDWDRTTEETPEDIGDDILAENYRAGIFEVTALDMVAYSADPYSMLAGFAKPFCGEAVEMTPSTGEDYVLPPHLIGYDNETYNAKIEQVFAEKNIEARAPLLHEAEKLLMDDMVVIPVIFNQNAVLVSENLSKMKATTYCPAIFTKTKLKDYELYIPVEE